MYSVLKRVELQGFKSFAPKTVLEFPARVTAIVGPNGSGKSNIIDAFRWVVGEREAKQLRGDTLENLIFAGTPKRPPAGFARVSLCFDNRERTIDHEAPEVAVERKVDRSGVSQFFLGGSEVRLRDLVSLLARARLGSRGLTMVGQGQSDIFVHSSPRERREMIEEVLGLREFRLKKEHAERQLAGALVNMEKVTAMVEEIAPHLRFLRRQRHRFERREALAEELRVLENQHFAARYHELVKARASLEAPLRKLREEAGRERAMVVEAERALHAIDKKVEGGTREDPLHQKLSRALEEHTALERGLARVEARIEFAAHTVTPPAGGPAEHAAHLIPLVRALLKDLEYVLQWDNLSRVREKLEEWVKKLHRAVEGEPPPQGKEWEDELQALKEKIKAVDVAIKGIQEEEAKRRDEERRANQTLRLEVERLEAAKGTLRDIERRTQEVQFEGEKVNLKMEELTREWESAGRERQELASLPLPGGEAALERADPVRDRPAEGTATAALGRLISNGTERRMVRLRGELAAIGEIDEALVKEAQETETRHSFLSKELEDLVKATKDLKNLIKELETKIHHDFKQAFRNINDEFNTYVRLMFGGGRAHLRLVTPPQPRGEEEVPVAADRKVMVPPPTPAEPLPDTELSAGVEIDLNLPKKKITSLDMLSGGERSLVSIAALFALIAVSPPPFLVLDEIDAALDDDNARRFAELVKEFSKKTQFIIITHNRATMEVADVLYGITMEDDGVSKVLSLKLE